ncbi:tryptophan-rich sensory protein [Pseudoflavonifractor capillosus]|uniref:TspO/MBR family protein n=1 Tax=Pseudoflavonifractor capillosus TaxID=106588 RepID=UPI00195955B8|nr:TspO/MBR family protein [Pseudoflavonifractor capillosus]MBM6896234.1 tryptophan-rich sensory protein [Pseudoflavonifractor capillosus]
MSHKLRQLIICIAIPLAVGGLSAYLTMGAMETFESLKQPPLSPPGWLFPVVWTALFALMGIASYLVVRSPAPERTVKRALIFYGIQLGLNFFWTILFFNLGLYLVSFFWLILLWCFILLTTLQFAAIRRLAGYLMIPYLIWVAFAGYLNFAIFWLNR